MKLLAALPILTAAVAAGCNPAPGLILAAMDNPDPAVRSKALVKLRTYCRDEAKPEIARRLIGIARQDTSSRVRTTAIRSMIRFTGWSQVRGALLELLSDADPSVRRETAATLARFDGPVVTAVLEQRFHLDADPAVRSMALASLLYRDADAHALLLGPALSDPAIGVRRTAERLRRRYGVPVPATQTQPLTGGGTTN